MDSVVNHKKWMETPSRHGIMLESRIVETKQSFNSPSFTRNLSVMRLFSLLKLFNYKLAVSVDGLCLVRTWSRNGNRFFLSQLCYRDAECPQLQNNFSFSSSQVSATFVGNKVLNSEGWAILECTQIHERDKAFRKPESNRKYRKISSSASADIIVRLLWWR